MPKTAKALTAIEVRRLTDPGRHAVGTVAGLVLIVKPSSARSWALRRVIAGRRVEQGLGGFPEVTLAQAIERAREVSDQVRNGINSSAERRARRTRDTWTFRKVATAYVTAHRAEWKNAKHADQWTSTLTTYAFPHFGDKHVRDITKSDVLAAVNPIWTTKTETATRVLQRIELVLSYAMQAGYRPEGLNPARWRGHLDVVLARPSKVAKVKHHAALPMDEMFAFVERLKTVQGMGARALHFAILTAARSGEVRSATWQEVDIPGAVWSIPAVKMKAGRAHRVPLSAEALELLQSLPRFEGTDLVFPGNSLKPLSDMTLLAVLKRMNIDAVPHGFRSTFRDWAAERTSFPPEVAEMALAHVIASGTEAAYRRGDLFEKRGEMMEHWAKFIATAPQVGNVRALRGAA